MSDQNAPKPARGRPFPPGTSGNPDGRPRGSRNRLTLRLKEMLDADAEELISIMIEMARSGDKVMLAKCVERIMPRLRERLLSLELPPLTSAADRARVINAIRTLHLAGEITLSEAEGEVRFADKQIEAIESSYYANETDELLQTRGSGIARLKDSEPSVRHDGAPANDVSDATAANDGAPEITSKAISATGFEVAKDNGAAENIAPDCAAQREKLRSNGSPSVNAGSTTDATTPECSGTSTEGDRRNENSADYHRPAKGDGASAPEDGDWHEAAD